MPKRIHVPQMATPARLGADELAHKVAGMNGQPVGGWQYPIVHDDWAQLLERHLDGPQLVRTSAVTDVVRSILHSPARFELRYAMSMWDLIVTTAPGTPGPVDAVRVSTPNYPNALVEHLPLVGRADRIERPAEDAVPLFWRFLKEKYGIEGKPAPL